MSVKVNIYLNFGGSCQAAFDFYAKAFNTPLAYSCTYGEQEGMDFVKAEDKGKILHCSLPIAAQTMLLGSDVVEGTGDPGIVVGTNVSISLDPSTEDEAKRLFAALSAGGKVIMPLDKSFWNSLYGMFTDQFGILWMINYQYEDCIE